jgi:hypothetical protein
MGELRAANAESAPRRTRCYPVRRTPTAAAARTRLQRILRIRLAGRDPHDARGSGRRPGLAPGGAALRECRRPRRNTIPTPLRFMSSTLSRGGAALFVVAIACSSAAAQSLMSQYGQTVLSVGDPVPGLPGLTIQASTNFETPVLDQNGNMLLRTRIAGANIAATNDRVYLYGRTAADLRVVLRSGDQAPGLPAGVLMQTATGTGPGNAPRLSPFGEYLFFSSSLFDNAVSVTTANDTALFWGPIGNYVVLAREGDPVVINGVTGAYTYGPQTLSHQFAAINASGSVLFSTTLLGAPADQDAVMVTGAPGALLKVFQEGDVYPDGSIVVTVSGTTMSFVNQLNELGQVLHEVRFSNSSGTATAANDRALAIWTPGVGDVIVAREGQQAPGLAAGVVFGNPLQTWTVDTGSAVFTKSGKTAINAGLDGNGTTTIDDRAVYYGGTGGLSLVARKNDPTGQPNDVRWGVANNSSLTCNDAGQVAFVSSLQNGSVPGTITTANDTCIAFGTVGNVAPIAIEGAAVPGLPGHVFGAISGGTNSPHLNERGQVLMQLDVIDTSTTTSRRMLFGYDAVHGMRVVADSNDTFATPSGPATWFTVGTVQFNSADGGSSHFNNNGDFAMRFGLNAPGTAVIARGHLGSLQGTPASLDSVTGGTHTFALDATPAHGTSIYVILGTASGTRPGTPSPLGPQTIPLNNDSWFSLSLALANTSVYVNSLWFTDAQGRNMAPASFVLPPNVPGLQGLMLHHAAVVLDGATLASTFVTEPVGLRIN